MKKITLCLAIVAISILSVHAQDGERMFKRFKGDVSLGYAAPLGSHADGGALFAMEPKFAVMDQLSVGMRIEVAVMARITGSGDNAELNNAKAAASYVLSADYYFTKNYSFRPFIGAGVGLFGIAEVDDSYVINNNDDAVTSTKFGGLIRVGAEVKHFRFGVEFNVIPNTDASIYNTTTGGSDLTKVKNGYIGLKVGFCFGGGPLNR